MICGPTRNMALVDPVAQGVTKGSKLRNSDKTYPKKIFQNVNKK
jgi:hypothetical protein